MKKKTKLIWFLILLILSGAVGVYFYFAEGNPPEILVSPHTGFLNHRTKVMVSAKDLESGLKSLNIYLVQRGLKIKVVSQKLDTRIWNYEFGLGSFPLREGSFYLEVEAVDRSWNHLFKGNKTSIQKSYFLDNSPAIVNLKGYNRYVYQGGSGIVVFNVNEPLMSAGVKVGDIFFPAYRYKGFYVCFYTFPYNFDPASFHPRIVVKDRALNVTDVSVPCIVKKKKFLKEKINITQDFLNKKMIQFLKEYPEKDLLSVFLRVNRELRKKCRNKLKKICDHSTNEILWNSSFLRQPNTKRMSGFGVKRSYFYKGTKIDEQTHLGIDLASVKNAKILASNNGKVIYTDFLGIYGKTVIIDHGLGVFTLYGHLSNILVNRGEYVKKHQVIGTSGQSGLAGGDHLHFSVLISGIPTNPIEWWDKNWLKKNILCNLP